MTIIEGTNLKMVVTLAMPGFTVSQNVFYAKYDGPGSATEEDVTDDMAAWSEEMWANMSDTISNLVSISEVIVSRQIGGFPLVFEEIGTVPGTFVGASGGEMLPHGVAMVMRVATSGLRSIARKYIAGVTEGFSDGTGFTAAAVIDALAFLVDWITGPPTVGGRNYIVGIISAKDGGFKTFGVEGIVSSIQGYQRRRKPGVGI